MVEHENVRDALKDAFELIDSSSITIDGKEVTVSQFKELIGEKLYNVTDLLGLEDIYLNK